MYKRQGFLYSMGTLSNKIGLGFSGLLAGWMLTAINYVPGAEQTAAVQHGIYLSTGIPLIVAGILCAVSYTHLLSYKMRGMEVFYGRRRAD